jgi:hypothetical protein
LLADALTLQGIIWARLWVYDASINVLRRAAEVAESAGAFINAGLAILTLIEEHGATRRLPPAEVHETYLRADGLLKDTQDAEAVTRLRACARVVMRRLSDTPIHEKNFSLYGVVHDSGGSVTKAARLLGVTHQSLNAMLDGRHQRLQEKRTPAKKRLKSLIKKPKG